MTRRLCVFFSMLVLAVGLAACDETTTNNKVEQPQPDAGIDAHADADVDAASPCDPDSCTGGRECVVRDDQAVCECPAGTHDEAGSCVPDAACEPTTCNGHGTCSEVDGEPTCACETGYTGPACADCDTADGWMSDGEGGCTDDPCSLVDCGPEKVCVVDAGAAVCQCPAGTHDEDGACVVDESCMPTTCNGHGTCDDTQGQVSCACEDGWKGEFCGACDDVNGYHPDGQGGCTTDPCLPNPCTDPNRTICQADTNGTSCACDPGYHLEDDACVPDETCAPDSCSGNGTCDDTGGIISCACDSGYAGDDCSSCDTANGFHDDGQGGCTTDPCLPNPCTEPNKTSCVSSSGAYVCECDTGFHPDGQGGCTDDPCLPDTCAAQNKACRVDGNGQAECYTPDCDDGNPCTVDTLVGGVCQHTTEPDGTSCSTDVCLVGQTCQSGQCVGSTPLDCDDQNPCTDDVCDPAQGGCVNIDDDTNVPDDGVHCTADTCSGGIASHTPDDTACDDALWCTGVESCVPSASDADAQGCVARNVPQPPADPGPCEQYTTCDNATQSFVLETLATGTTCNDGIVCTTGDACDAQGQCVGQLQSTCAAPGPGTSCTSTTPIGPIDIPVAFVSMDVTFEGQDPEVTDPYYAFSIYGIEKQTGVWVQLARYNNPSNSGGSLSTTTKLMPGVYDIVYTTDSTDQRLGLTTSYYDIPASTVILQHDVVIPAGSSTLSVDVTPTPVNVNVTFEGQDPEVTDPYYAFSIYGIEQETGVWVQLARYNNPSNSGGSLSTTTKIMEGTYDIVYTTDSTDQRLGLTTSYYDIPAGTVILQRGVTIDASNNTLNIDVTPTPVTVNVTFEGQDPEVTDPYYAFSIYGIEQETGVWVQLARYNNPSNSGGSLSTTTKIMEGTYDIVYTTDSTDQRLGLTTSYYDIPAGTVILQRGVTIDASNNTLNIDVTPTPVTVNVTFEGQDPEVTDPYYAFSIYGIEQETGVWVQLARYNNPSNSGGTLSTTTKIMEGTYDIVYTTDSTDQRLGLTTSYYEIPAGTVILQRGVTIDSSNNTLNIDVTPTPVTVDVTFEGQDPEVTDPYYAFSIYGIEQETGVWVQLARYNNPSNSGGSLSTTTKIMPGTYDIVYTTDSVDRTLGLTTSYYDIPAGTVILQRGVTIDASNNALAFDVTPVPYDPTITFMGQDPEVTDPYYAFSVYAVDRNTGVWVQLGRYNNPSNSGGSLSTTTKIMPGTYDLIYTTDSSDQRLGLTSSYYEIPEGTVYLGMCMDIQ
ncbi:hypothetical protein FIV42_21225 [Persicimonas caeni]|uniref:EGF-like domain-containing protein n=1 Tax=Persicimonas caeni TaxID=2292766 RepID=A0A4Y6PY42_PERCE|nr:hypothetical protein [Persicimonas caeni]QDG53173.1 hypothetical protein FIV42_21225 [Persicimonas caeni]QED34395.1 hypothetical protein FRD00_21220 [Persicimonas caeni]